MSILSPPVMLIQTSLNSYQEFDGLVYWPEKDQEMVLDILVAMMDGRVLVDRNQLMTAVQDLVAITKFETTKPYSALDIVQKLYKFKQLYDWYVFVRASGAIYCPTFGGGTGGYLYADERHPHLVILPEPPFIAHLTKIFGLGGIMRAFGDVDYHLMARDALGPDDQWLLEVQCGLAGLNVEGHAEHHQGPGEPVCGSHTHVPAEEDGPPPFKVYTRRQRH